MPEIKLDEMGTTPGPYLITMTGLADANLSGLSPEVRHVVNRIIIILEHEPQMLCKSSADPGGHEFITGVTNCPGGSLVIKFSLDEQRKQVRVLEIIHPALL